MPRSAASARPRGGSDSSRWNRAPARRRSPSTCCGSPPHGARSRCSRSTSRAASATSERVSASPRPRRTTPVRVRGRRRTPSRASPPATAGSACALALAERRRGCVARRSRAHHALLRGVDHGLRGAASARRPRRVRRAVRCRLRRERRDAGPPPNSPGPSRRRSRGCRNGRSPSSRSSITAAPGGAVARTMSSDAWPVVGIPFDRGLRGEGRPSGRSAQRALLQLAATVLSGRKAEAA